MEHKHLDAAALERLLAADRSAEQTELLFHLLSVCPGCRAEGGWLLELHQANALPPVFGPIDAALARSRSEAPRLWADLSSLAPQGRLIRLQDDSRFVSWGLCELLVHTSRQLAPEQAAEALHLADLAVRVAGMIPVGEPFEEQWVYQLRSLAWAALANTRRVQGDLSGADSTFEIADSCWAAGTVDSDDALGYEPVLLDLKAPLRTAQRRFPEAIALLDRAIALFLEGDPEHRDPHLAGRSLISKAGVLIETGASESAIQVQSPASPWPPSSSSRKPPARKPPPPTSSAKSPPPSPGHEGARQSLPDRNSARRGPFLDHGQKLAPRPFSSSLPSSLWPFFDHGQKVGRSESSIAD